MFYPVSAFIGLRYAKASKGNNFIAFINFFSVAGITLGLTALITVLSVMNGFEGQLKQRILGIVPHIVVDTRNIDEVQRQAVRHVVGVLASSDFIESEGVIQSGKGLQGVMIQGVEPQVMAEHSVIAQNMVMGDFSLLREGEYGVIIGRALALQLDIRPGDHSRLISAGASVYSPFGRMPSQRLFTVVGIYDVGSELDNKVILLHINDAASLLRNKPEKLLQTRLFLDDAFDYLQVLERLAPFNLPSDNWRSRQGPLFDAVKMEKNMMGLMLLLIIAVAAFNIVSALVMVVTEKQGDIAILRTQGMSALKVMEIFLFSGLYNGLKGTVYGVIGGLLLVSQLNNILALVHAPIMLGSGGQGLPVDLQWHQVGLVVALSLLLCFVATIYPAYRAVKIDPAKALKYE
jgi:lipoprotein-releasing system permease protein